MADIKSRIGNLEKVLVQPGQFDSLSLKELRKLAHDYAAEHFGRELTKAEFKRFDHCICKDKMNRCDVTENHLLPQIGKGT